ncbi:MAG: hypothetical protein R3300_05445 [Candidatus Promineifilaceae bacterium]|nr:hypothetical protein [Candidatus Promineifilaceae bacterium]
MTDRPTTQTLTAARTRTWPVRLIGLLLILQAISLWVPLWLYVRLLPAGWQNSLALTLTELFENSPEIQEVLVYLIVGTPLFLGLFVGGVFVALLWRPGWLLAMISQSMLLLVTLTLHFSRTFRFVDPLMASAIVMVLLLNAVYVRQILASPPVKALPPVKASPTVKD